MPDSPSRHRSTPSADTIRRALLVLRAQSGDEAAFAALMQQYGDGLLRYLRGLVGDDAEDVWQETWLAVYRNLSGLAEPAAFPVWLLRSARHRALNWLRRHRRERELLVDVPLDAVSATPDTGEALSEAFDGIDAARLDAAMREMPPPQREALILRFRDDLSYAQIAQITAVPVGTVRARLHYAKKRLAQLLQLGVSHDTDH
jgi:RNA polymerase sigma-70 factor (ECF subfamily)